MTEGNGNAWENWERNTEESHEYADFILKELGSITNTVSTFLVYHFHMKWTDIVTEILTK